jgi:hypothetical protein
VGFVVSGARPKTVLVRGVGPALGAFGVTGAALDPSIQVFSATGSLVAANDNWGDLSSLVDASQRAGAFPLALGSRDAALLLNLGPGNYTVVASATGPDGVGLVEVYELP